MADIIAGSSTSTSVIQLPILGNVDLTKKPIQPSLFIAKPDKTIVGKMPEVFDVKLTVKLGGVNTLEFYVPYELDIKHTIAENSNIEKLKDRYLIKYVAGNYVDWFYIDTPEVGVEDQRNYKHVICSGLAQKLGDKIISQYTVGNTGVSLTSGANYAPPVNCTTALGVALQDTNWTIGYVDATFDTMYRSYNISSKSALDFIFNDIAKTLQAIVVFDTNAQTVSMYQPDSVGQDRGLRFAYGKYARTMKKTRNHDNFCTRLRVKGKTGVSINSVNTTGTDYIEDYSFFMLPYEEDANGNVIAHSDYMSDSLCHAMIAYSKKLQTRSGDFSNYLAQLTNLQETLTAQTNTLNSLQATLAGQQAELDVANASNNIFMGAWNSTTAYVTGNIVNGSDGKRYLAVANNINSNPTTNQNPNWSDGTNTKSASDYSSQISTTNSQIATQNTAITNTNNQINSVTDNITSLQNDIALTNNFTPAQILERSNYIIEREYTDNNSNTPADLLASAQNAIKKLNQPTDVVTIDVANFLEIVEAQRDWDKLNIGDTVFIDYPQYGSQIKAKIIEYVINWNSSQQYNNLTVTIANFQDILTDEQRLIDVLYRAASTSTTVDMSKLDWDNATNTANSVQSILNNTWDATKKAITAGVNESVRIDNRGITIKDPNDANNYLVAQHGILAITNDGGNTWKNALTKDGLVAERIVGQLLVGTQLTIDASDVNGTNLFTVNSQGVTIQGSTLTVTGGIPNSQLNPTSVTSWDGAVNLANNSVQLGQQYGNSVIISSANGIVVNSTSGNSQVTMNSGGLAIAKNTGTVSAPTWVNQLWADSSGNLYANNLITQSLKMQTGGATPKTLIDAGTMTIDFSGFTNITPSQGLLKGLTVTNASNQTTFAVDTNGNVTISGSVSMTGGSISWGSVNTPSPAQVGALATNAPQLTYINSNGVYTGTLQANQVVAGTISGFTITGSTITGSTIQTASSGTRVTMSANYCDMNWYDGANHMLQIYDGISYIGLYAPTSGIPLIIGESGGGTIEPQGTWNFSGASVTGLSVTATFG